MESGEAKEIEIQESEGFLEIRFLGPYDLGRFKKQMTLAVQASADRGVVSLLIDLSPVPLFGSVSTLDRFEMGVHASQIAKKLRVAVYGTEEQIDPEKFGARVAQNRGVNLQVFTRRDAAIAWLLSTDPV